jgi:hypothetical protein
MAVATAELLKTGRIKINVAVGKIAGRESCREWLKPFFYYCTEYLLQGTIYYKIQRHAQFLETDILFKFGCPL